MLVMQNVQSKFRQVLPAVGTTSVATTSKQVTISLLTPIICLYRLLGGSLGVFGGK